MVSAIDPLQAGATPRPRSPCLAISPRVSSHALGACGACSACQSPRTRPAHSRPLRSARRAHRSSAARPAYWYGRSDRRASIARAARSTLRCRSTVGQHARAAPGAYQSSSADSTHPTCAGRRDRRVLAQAPLHARRRTVALLPRTAAPALASCRGGGATAMRQWLLAHKAHLSSTTLTRSRCLMPGTRLHLNRGDSCPRSKRNSVSARVAGPSLSHAPSSQSCSSHRSTKHPIAYPARA